MHPLVTAIKGKGPFTLARRLGSISQRYGLGVGAMEGALERLARVLEQFDCRATLPVTAVALARNSAPIYKYQVRGIEFAVHGYLHVDYSELPLEEQIAHVRRAVQVFRERGIQFEGFRCPYLRWNADTLKALCENGLSYDSSTSLFWDVPPDQATDSYARALAFYGAQPAAEYPALPSIDSLGGLVSIPYCLPDDEALVERLRWTTPGEKNGVWPAMFHDIHARGELFVLGLHPERTADCADALVATLQAVRAAGASVWRARLAEISAWWRARAEAAVQVTAVQEGLLELDVSGPPGTTILLRSVEAETPVEAWFDGYQLARQLPCRVRSGKRPFVGVAPDAAPALTSFLKQQGYILEVSAHPADYSVYLAQPVFAREEERSLLAHIEASRAPLARLGRWPNGARSALCVTGDIDALTMWDYGLRLLGR